MVVKIHIEGEEPTPTEQGIEKWLVADLGEGLSSPERMLMLAQFLRAIDRAKDKVFSFDMGTWLEETDGYKTSEPDKPWSCTTAGCLAGATTCLFDWRWTLHHFRVNHGDLAPEDDDYSDSDYSTGFTVGLRAAQILGINAGQAAQLFHPPFNNYVDVTELHAAEMMERLADHPAAHPNQIVSWWFEVCPDLLPDSDHHDAWLQRRHLLAKTLAVNLVGTAAGVSYAYFVEE